MSYSQQQLNNIFKYYNEQANHQEGRISNTLLYSDTFFFYASLICSILLISFFNSELYHIPNILTQSLLTVMCLFSIFANIGLLLNLKVVAEHRKTLFSLRIKDNIRFHTTKSYFLSLSNISIFFFFFFCLFLGKENTQNLSYLAIFYIITKTYFTMATQNEIKNLIASNWTITWKR